MASNSMHLVIALISPLPANHLFAAGSSTRVEKGEIKLGFKILIYILIKSIQLRLRDTGNELTRLEDESKSKDWENERDLCLFKEKLIFFINFLRC